MATEFALLSPQQKGLPPDWRAGRLSDVAALNPDQITTATHLERIAYVDISCVSRGQISKPVDIPLSEAPSRARRLVRAGDTILSTVRPGNRAYAFIRSPPKNLVCSTGFVVLRARQGSADPRFIYFLTSSERVIQHLAVIAEKQTAYPSVTAKDVGECTVVIPPLPEQRAIARVLGTLDDEIVSRMGQSKGLRRVFDHLMRHLLDGSWSVHEGESWLREVRPLVQAYDDKIELNRRMNQTLEEICRALFKFWFVDFGPVRAKAEGRWKKGESLPGMPADMWDFWPSEFEESEIGEIPKGWKPVSLTEIASLLTGGTPSTAEPAYWNGGIPWVSGKDVSAAKGGFIIQTERTITGEGVENSATALLPARTVVITARGTVGALGVIASDMCISQTNYGLKALDGIGDNFLLFTVGNAIDQLQRASYGTIFDTITTRNLQATIVVLPPEPLRSEFELRTHFLMERVLLKLHEGKTLASTRDALLPKLLSGEIRVPVDEGK